MGRRGIPAGVFIGSLPTHFSLWAGINCQNLNFFQIRCPLPVFQVGLVESNW